MRNPRGNWREEPWWHWDWPGRPDTRATHLGNGAQVLSSNEPPRGSVAANLWVPDVESRNGWRENWVYRDVPPPPPQRKLGL